MTELAVLACFYTATALNMSERTTHIYIVIILNVVFILDNLLLVDIGDFRTCGIKTFHFQKLYFVGWLLTVGVNGIKGLLITYVYFYTGPL